MSIAPSDERTASLTTAEVSPVLMAWVTRTGISVPRLDAPPELLHAGGSPELDRAARSLALGRPGLTLLEALGRRAPSVSVPDAVDEVVDGLGLDGSERSALLDLVEGMIAGGLLLPRGAEAPERPEWRELDVHRPPASGPDAPEGALIGVMPVAFPVDGAGFVHVDHDGALLGRLSGADLAVLASFGAGCTPDEAWEAFGATHGGWLDRDQFDGSVVALAALGLVVPFRPEPQEQMREALVRKFGAFADADAAVLEVVSAEIERARTEGVGRAVVVPVDCYEIPMLSLGMIVAYAKAHRDGALEQTCAFTPPWYTRSDRFRGPLEQFGDQAAIFLFSHYVWTSEENLLLSEAVKDVLPAAVTVHGGPNVPKYEGDCEAWFAAHPHVDVAVHGEGEATLAHLLEVLPAVLTGVDGQPDLSVLADVPGLTFRTPDGVHRTADRERIADLDTIPSPYLSGVYDDQPRRWQWPSIIFESNRGCPYGCTFCDWGSATLSRIRKFDLDRIKAEMEWAAKRGLTVFSMADANYGIFDRDVEIVEWVVDLKRRYGAPLEFDVNFAKNRAGNLTRIVQILADAGINTLSVASLQSMDEDVLTTIRRKNLKREKFDALTMEFRQAGFPLYTDVMIGLPGSTVDSVRNDLQAVMDRELYARANPTQMLVNSPMNDPAYRAEHGLVAKPGEHLQQSATYTYEDWLEMMAIRRFYYFAERRGILRQIATYVRTETGMREVDVFDRIRERGVDPVRWPQLTYLIRVAPDEYVPPGSWAPLVDELRRFCIEEFGVADDSALDSVLAVQQALLPARGRQFPQVLDLAHDYAVWHAAVIDAKRRYTDGTWHEHVPALRDLGPGAFEVRDEDDCCTRVIGQNPQGGITEFIWELDAPTTRPKQPVE